MLRRTKILATLGPSTDRPGVLEALVRAGVDVVRLNLSHGSHEDHLQRASRIRELAEAAGRQIGVLVDLQGPKIRIGRFADGPVELCDGDRFTLDAACPADAGDAQRVGLTFPGLIGDLSAGDTLLLADGAIELQIRTVSDDAAICRVINGGTLSDNKGINKKGGGLSAPALTEKDREDIAFAASIGADYLAISFVQSAADVVQARSLLAAVKGSAHIVSKVERAEAVENIEGIIEASDAIMVARGDLGVEIGDAELPAVQKLLIRRARRSNKVVITATQMMESMIEHPIPTRAEVFDVANAVLDGTDAVMLSAETAAGRFPVKAVQAMDRICREAEKQSKARKSHHRLNSVFGRIDEAIAMATMYTANHLQVAAIAALTESGSTPKWMSRISSSIPIYALSSQQSTQRRVTLFRGVYPIGFELTSSDSQQVNVDIVDRLLQLGAVAKGELVLITKGDLDGVEGGTNVMKVLKVGEQMPPGKDSNTDDSES
ncbi:MAG: pyruvate kinase [Gammaproteobacteria bacterium]|nr:pyruvate kinase [Gammaproteobacteria bacterium]